jgi:hypothetical protein
MPPVVGAREPNVSLHVPGSVSEKRKYPVAVDPFAFTVPLSVAETFVIPLAATVVTVGACGVVNDSTDPNDVPALFDAIAQ